MAEGEGSPVRVTVETAGDRVSPSARLVELARALNRLVADPAEALSMGIAGRRRVEDTFSWAAVARRTEALYAELVEERQKDG